MKNTGINLADVKKYIRAGLKLTAICQKLGVTKIYFWRWANSIHFSFKDFKKTLSLPKSSNGQKHRLKMSLSRRCEICGYYRFVEVAHIVPSREGGKVVEGNVISLCPNHHRLFDQELLTFQEYKKIEPLIRKAKKKFGVR